MSATKTPEPAVLFAALADPTRLRLLNLLRGGEVCVCDLVDGVGAPQPTVSRHLAVLRRAGFVRVRKDGLWSHYSLATDASELHARLLECLDTAATLERRCAADERRVARARAARGCCE